VALKIVRLGEVYEKQAIYRAIQLQPQLFQTTNRDVISKRRTKKLLRTALDAISGYLEASWRANLKRLIHDLSKRGGVVDLGPEGGHKGGELLACGAHLAIAASKVSHTRRFLKPLLEAQHDATPRDPPLTSGGNGLQQTGTGEPRRRMVMISGRKRRAKGTASRWWNRVPLAFGVLAMGLLASGLVAGGPPTAGRPGGLRFTPTASAQETPAPTADPLPSWNDGPAKQAILKFVAQVTDETADTFVPAGERVATFDNDGTLWVEQPMYGQMAFALDRVKALAAEHPEWKTRQPFQAALEGDLTGVAATGEKGLLALVLATHSGMTAEQFERSVTDWTSTAKHPRFQQLYTSCVYQPQVELLAFLRNRGFKTFIVSGGGIEFMRPWSERVYGIPPDQVVGSSVVTEFQMRDGKPVLVRLPKINFIDDKAGKPVGIHKFIGRNGRFWPSAIRTATCRCCSTQPAEPVPAWVWWYIIRMPNANMLTIATVTSGNSTRCSTWPPRTSG
jgi:phosphoglycolate phosphatase-like HAD superfamily hydrolase